VSFLPTAGASHITENKMLSLSSSAALARALSLPIDDRLKELLALRSEQLGGEIAGLARFVVVEPGDTLEALEAELGFSILGDPELVLGPEWVADHGHVLEAVWLLTDDGFAHVAWLPRLEGMDPELIEFCTTHASEHA